MFISAVVVAAGKGLRLKSKISKPLVRINSKPLMIYSLEVLSNHPLIKEIVVVANSSNIEGVKREVKRYKINKIEGITAGGIRRQDSVENGLKAVNSKADYVLVHDAARPFIDKKMVSLSIRQSRKYGAAIVGVPVKNTIKRVVTRSPGARQQSWRGLAKNFGGHQVTSDYVVKETVNRENLWEVQTPQVFRKSLLLAAYDKFREINVTDDAMLLEKMGAKVGVVFGSYDNIKVTTPEDLILAKVIVRCKNKGF